MKKYDWWNSYKVLSQARKSAKAGRRALSRGPVEARDEEAQARAGQTLDELEKLLQSKEKSPAEIERVAARLHSQLLAAGLRKEKSVPRQYAESIAWAVGVALLIRFFLFEPFKIPTGSMIPTLQIGDHIFVSKSAYGLKLPFTKSYLARWGDVERGDIVVFPFPIKGHPDYGKDFIKRVVGLPGDRIRLTGNILHVNDVPVETKKVTGLHDCGGNASSVCRCVKQEETMGEHTFITQHCGPDGWHPDWPLPSGETDSLPEFVVPEGNVFVMGDNRDNSSDGRFWTPDPLDQFVPQYQPRPDVQTVPLDLLRGRAVVIWWADDKSRLFSVVE